MRSFLTPFSRFFGFVPADMRDFFADLPTLTTPRLILRKARMRDAADIYAYAQDEEVARHVFWEPHRSLRDSRAYVRYLKGLSAAGEPSSYVMELKETGKVIGTVGFVDCREEHAEAEIGYSMGKAYWNRGLMTEAVGELLRMCFEDMGLHRVCAKHETDNPASGRVLEKCGMRCEGVMRGAVWNKGRYADVALWAILEDDPRPGGKGEDRDERNRTRP